MDDVRFKAAQRVKRSLLQVGYYERALAQQTFPGVAVLSYHGVLDDGMPASAMPLQYLHIHASTLESHCRVLRRFCDPISLEDWRASGRGGPPLPRRPVLITFDDGYRSVLTRAMPILAKYDLPAAVFVCSAPIETRRLLWFDDVAEREGEEAVEAWKSREYAEWRARCLETALAQDGDPREPLTADDLAALSRIEGIEIGGHTVSHPILSRASVDTQREEIERNLNSIRAWTGKPVRAFKYPNGRPNDDYSDETMAILRDVGIDMAFTTRAAFASPAEPPLERSSFIILADTTDAELAHRLAYSWPR